MVHVENALHALPRPKAPVLTPVTGKNARDPQNTGETPPAKIMATASVKNLQPQVLFDKGNFIVLKRAENGPNGERRYHLSHDSVRDSMIGENQLEIEKETYSIIGHHFEVM